MRVTGYAPAAAPPSVPRILLTPTGGYGRDGRPADCGCAAVAISPLELTEGEWLGVRADGRPEPFKLQEEGEWKAREAVDAVRRAAAGSLEDPAKALKALKAAADLLGLNLPTVTAQLEKVKRAGESLADTYLRTKGKGDDGA